MEMNNPVNDPHFSLLFWNVRSIKSLNKFTKFKMHLTELVSNKEKIIDCLVVAESWINELEDFKLYELKNYNSYMVSRDSSQGGGLIVYVRKTYAVNVITRICNQHVEAILVEILSSFERQKVLAVYRPPSGNISIFNDAIDDFLSDQDEIMMVGDMNVNILHENSCNEYQDVILMNDYVVANNSITRLTSGTLIDHIVLKQNTDALIITSKNCKLSDHNLLMLFKRIAHKSNWITSTVTKMDHNRIREELILKSEIDFVNIISQNLNVDSSFAKLLEVVKSSVDNARLTYKIRHKYEDEVPPYVDVKYARLTAKINNLHDKIRKRIMRNQAVSLLQSKLITLDDKLKRHTEMKAKCYYSNLISNNKMCSWKIINDITGRSRKYEELVIQQNKITIYDKKEIANLFQNKFTSNGCSLTVSYEMKFLGEPLANSMVMFPVSVDDIGILMKELSVKKALGSDGIPAKVWKDNIDILAPIITVLVNDMLETSVYPNVLKIAAIKPIFKNGSKTDIENYRGISLLPTINKVIERVIYDKIENFIRKFKQFDELQFGYRKHYGTQDALCKLYSMISKALDMNKYVVAVFFDISKAFDSINHKLLLYKLEKMGIRGRALELLRSYLTNRKQFVKIMDELSEIVEIIFGVPQGSCLGPLLFVLLLYDLKFIETSSSIIKYADDVAMVLVCDQISDIPSAVNRDIDLIKSYYTNNGLTLNANKSKYMTFGFELCKELDDLMELNGIEKVKSIKYLGAVVDRKLCMTEHTNKIVKKISQSMSAMYVIRNQLPTSSLMQFYNAFIGSHLYCNGFLICRLSTVDIHRLQVIQNKALKTAYGLERRFSTEKLFNEVAVNVLPVMGIAYLNVLLLTKKYVLGSFDDVEEITEGRRKNQLKYPRFRKKVFSDDISCLGPKVFNQLPPEIREIRSYSVFKRKLKNFLLNNKLIFLRGSKLDVNNIFETVKFEGANSCNA